MPICARKLPEICISASQIQLQWVADVCWRIVTTYIWNGLRTQIRLDSPSKREYHMVPLICTKGPTSTCSKFSLILGCLHGLVSAPRFFSPINGGPPSLPAMCYTTDFTCSNLVQFCRIIETALKLSCSTSISYTGFVHYITGGVAGTVGVMDSRRSGAIRSIC